MKILLISPNTLTAPYPVYPIGIDYVAGAIGDRHDVRILDMNTQPDGLAETIGEFQPDLIGFSIRNADNTDAYNLKSFIDGYRTTIDNIRQASDAPVVLGGSAFTIFPEALMETLQADYGIPGDGEKIIGLIESLEKGEDPSAKQGIISREKPICTQEEKSISQFCRRFDPAGRHVRFYLERGGMLNLQTKRGCPFKCVYCTYPHIDGGRLRLIDPDEVAATAVALQQAGAKYIFITDSTFNCSVQHSVAVAEAFIKVGLAIPWGAFFAPLAVDRDYFRIMAKAGLRHVEFGTESLSDKVLAAYGKPFTGEDVLCAHESACEAGLYVAHYLMPGGPGEDEKTLEYTLCSAEEMKKAVFFFFCGIRVYPHTALYDIALREGQISGDQSLLEPVFYKSGGLTTELIAGEVARHAAGRINWVTGAGGRKIARILARMYARGSCGPLWEHLLS